MNRLVLLLAASLAAAAAAPAPEGSSTSAPVAIVRSVADGPDPDGSYSWAYEAENGVRAEERGEPKAVARSADNEDGQAVSAQGGFSFTAPDGVLYELKYVADENGFQPRGAHLPTPPPVPGPIQRALDWIAARPEQREQRERRRR